MRGSASGDCMGHAAHGTTLNSQFSVLCQNTRLHKLLVEYPIRLLLFLKRDLEEKIPRVWRGEKVGVCCLSFNLKDVRNSGVKKA